MLIVISHFNRKESTPLHDAAYFGEPEIINILLEKGCNIDAINYYRLSYDVMKIIRGCKDGIHFVYF